MRTRSTVTGAFDTQFVREGRDRACSSGSWTPWAVSSTSFGGQVQTKVITDVVTPGFHALKECGGFLPLNPFSISTTTETREPADSGIHTARSVNCSRVTREARGSAFHVLLAEPTRLSVPVVPEAAIGAVVNAAVADARTQAWDALTFIREWESTRSMFANSAGRVSNFANRAASYARKFKRDPIRAFSDKWLEYRYGWMPALYDLKSAVEALSRAEIAMARGRGAQSIPFSDSVTYSENRGNYQFTCTETIEGSHLVRGWAAADMSNPFINNRVRVDPVLTLYETIPFSFVLDMFFQVGTWLEATTPVSGGRDLGSCGSVKTSYEKKRFGTITALSDSSSIRTGYGPVGGITVQVESYERFPHGTSLPGWNPRINPTRALDLLALSQGIGRNVRGLIRI